MQTEFFRLLGTLTAIVLVDLALSGDNALVIGAAASKLHGKQRTQAITFGGIAAIVLRILLTIGAVYILQFPFVNAIGGLLIMYIAVKLIRDMYEDSTQTIESQAKKHQISANSKLLGACVTIVVADFSMSLDNVLAIAALAKNNYVILVLGLLLSVIFLLAASSVIAHFMERYPLLLYVAGAVLAWTAVTMIVGDGAIRPIVAQWDNVIPGPLFIYIQLGFEALFVLFAYLWWNTHRASIETGPAPLPVTKQR